MKLGQRKIHLIAILFAVTMAFGCVLGVRAIMDKPTGEERFADQKMAVEANDALMQYFFDNGGAYAYPAYFGGSYIEDNLLHIRLASPTKQEREMLEKVLLPYADAIVYERCSFSRAEAQEYADEAAYEMLEQGYGVTGWYVDDKTGNVVIEVLEEDIAKAEKMLRSWKYFFRGIVGPSITVVKGEYFKTLTNPLYGGTYIRFGSDGASVGACGHYFGQNAFISCGHGDVVEGNNVTSNNRVIGTIARVQYSFAQQGDFSIILMNNNEADLSHKVGNVSNLTVLTDGTCPSPTIGTYVKKYGSSGGYAYGTVTQTNATLLNDDGVLLTGLTRFAVSSGLCIGGDSGGPVMAGNAFCGVLSGEKTIDGVSYVSFTPYSIINSAGFDAIGSHNCTGWTDAGSSYHSSYCGICHETVYEAHTEYWDHARGVCLRCGRTGPIQLQK